MQLEHKILPFEMKAASGDGSEFEGYANAFHCIDAAQEIVAPGAFQDSLDRFLDEGFIGGLNHNWDEPIGKPMSAKEDERGLFVKGRISDTEHGRDCRVLMKDGVVKKMSIGYRVKSDEFLDDAEAIAEYWQKWGYTPTSEDIARAQSGARVLLKIFPLYEFSPVTVPANRMADITRVKRYNADEIETERQFEKFLREAGFPKDAALTITASGFKALRRRDAEEEATTEPAAEEPAEAVVEVVETPTIQKATQAEVQALYADFLSRQACFARAR